MSLGGSGVCIGGVGSLREVNIPKNPGMSLGRDYPDPFLFFWNGIGTLNPREGSGFLGYMGCFTTT